MKTKDTHSCPPTSASVGLERPRTPLRRWRVLVAVGGLALALTLSLNPRALNPANGGATSPLQALTGPETAEAASAACKAALAHAVSQSAAAAFDPNPDTIRAAAEAVALAAIACQKPPPSTDPPPSDGSGGEPDSGPDDLRRPRIKGPGNRTDGRRCSISLLVSYGEPGTPVPTFTPSVATIRLNWDDGSTTTRTVEWGTTATFDHNFFWTLSPYGRLYLGADDWDGDPEGDGAEVHLVQATVLETGLQSDYSLVDHVGAFEADSWNTTH